MLDSFEDLRRAAAAECVFGCIGVVSAELELAGTRSQRSTYRVVVIRAVRGVVPEDLVLAHFGRPVLEAGERALVGARESRRFPGGWKVEYIARLGERDEASAIADLEVKLATLTGA